MKTLVSLIVVNYNGRRFLSRLLKSIENQTRSDIETILVDNASQDDSIAYVKRYFPQVKVVSTGNNGFGCACNQGATQARGQYLAFLNEDMYLPSDFVQLMINSFQAKLAKKIRVGAISCKLVDFDSDPDLMPNKYGGQLDLFGFPVSKYFRSDIFTISGCPFFMAKKTFIKVGGWNASIFLYGEDIDFSWRLKILGYVNFMEPKTHIFHFGGGTTGAFGPDKVAHNLTLSLVPMLTNYSWLTLCVVLPLYFIYILLINLFLLIMKSGDTSYNQAVIKRFKIILGNWRKILKLRKQVQTNRIYNDIFVLKYISFVPAFITNMSYQKLSARYVIKN